MSFEPPTRVRDEIAAALAHAPRASSAARSAASSDEVDSLRSASAASDSAAAEEKDERSAAEGQAAPISGGEEESEAAEALPSFEEIIFPLVDASGGKPLTGPGLGWCRAAFAENPAAFALCAEHALKYGRPPLGRLCVMVRDGDHRLWARAADRQEERVA